MTQLNRRRSKSQPKYLATVKIIEKEIGYYGEAEKQPSFHIRTPKRPKNIQQTPIIQKSTQRSQDVENEILLSRI